MTEIAHVGTLYRVQGHSRSPNEYQLKAHMQPPDFMLFCTISKLGEDFIEPSTLSCTSVTELQQYGTCMIDEITACCRGFMTYRSWLALTKS